MKDIYLFLQQQQTLSLALIAVLILLIIVEFLRLKLGARRLSPLEAIGLINHQQAVIVDLRNRDAFLNGHIVDSLSIPFSELEKQTKKLEKYTSRPIIVVCANGIESARAAAVLAKMRYNVQILAGGIRSWKDAELPLIKD